MIKPTLSMCKSIFPLLAPMLLLGLFGLTCLTTRPCGAQEQAGQATINGTIGRDGTGTIVVEARGTLPEPPLFYTAVDDANRNRVR